MDCFSKHKMRFLLCECVCWTVGYADETCLRNRVAHTSTGRTLLAWFVNLWRPTLIPRNNQVLFNIMLNAVMLRCGIILLMGSLRRKLLLVIRPGKMMTLWDLAQNYQLMGFTGQHIIRVELTWTKPDRLNLIGHKTWLVRHGFYYSLRLKFGIPILFLETS